LTLESRFDPGLQIRGGSRWS